MVRGNRHAHRNGTHHQHPPDPRAAEDNIQRSSQRQSVRSHHHQHRKQGDTKKANGRRNSTTRASQTKPATKQTTNPQRKIPTNTIGNSSCHRSDVMATIRLPETRHQPTHTPRNKRTDARHRRRALGRHIPANRGSGNPYRHHRTPGPRRQTHVHQTRPSPRR